MLVGNGCSQVGTGQRGIKTVWGKVTDEPKPEGLYFYNPISSRLVMMDIRAINAEYKTECYTRDIQQAEIKLNVIYNVIAEKAHELYRTVGKDYKSRIISPILSSILKDIIGKYNADKIIGMRDIVAGEILEIIKPKMDEYGINIQSVILSDIAYSDVFENAIEAKQVAEQKALEAKNKTVQIEEEAKQKLVTAEAEAKSMEIRAKALEQNRSLVEYEAVQKWNGVLPVNMYGSAPMPYISVLSKLEAINPKESDFYTGTFEISIAWIPGEDN